MDGDNCIHEAVRKNKYHILQVLGSYAVDIMALDNTGKTPLDIAQNNNYKESYNTLIQLMKETSKLQNETQSKILKCEEENNHENSATRDSITNDISLNNKNNIEEKGIISKLTSYVYDGLSETMYSWYGYTKGKIHSAFTSCRKQKHTEETSTQTYDEENKQSIGIQTFDTEELSEEFKQSLNVNEKLLEEFRLHEDITLNLNDTKAESKETKYYDLIMESVKNIEKNLDKCKKYNIEGNISEDMQERNYSRSLKKSVEESSNDDISSNSDHIIERVKSCTCVKKKSMVNEELNDQCLSEREGLKESGRFRNKRFVSSEDNSNNNDMNISFRSLSEVPGEIKGRLRWKKRNNDNRNSN